MKDLTSLFTTVRNITTVPAAGMFLACSLLIFTAQPALAVNLKLTRTGDLTSTKFDELGFDPTGLVGYWQLNGNALDSSIYGNDGTIFGAVATTDRFGTAGRAMSFNGTTDYIDTGTNNLPLGAADRTISAWIKLTGYHNWQGIYGYGSAVANKGFYFGFDTADKLIVGRFGANSSSSTVGVSLGVWTQAAVVYSADNVTFYVNGNSAGSFAFTNVDTTNVYGRIGRTIPNWDGVTGNYTLDGSIDEVKVFSRALSAAEVLSMYNHEKGKFSIDRAGTARSLEFVEDSALAIQMKSKKKNLTVKGTFKE